MQIWLSKGSDVPLREQLIAQVKLAILSQDLKPGQKLPSTREIARRFKIHSNTVSAAYRELSESGWVDMRAGSGIYVRKFKAENTIEAQLGLDNLIVEFLQVARRKGFSLADVQSRIRHWMRLQPPDHFLVIDPDPHLRSVLMAEMGAATGFRVEGAGLDDCSNPGVLIGAIPVALHVHAEAVTAALPPKMACLLIHTRSAHETLKEEKRPSADDLITVVSHWPDFLHFAHSVLAAVDIDSDSLSFRNTAEKGWERGLRSSSFVITDTATAARMPPGVRVRVFRVIADSSLSELRNYVERFLTRQAP
ncbi:MAG TPA: GntR family transcriptional regulator [Blastocatellia bacterium]|nr:GntR family transcriptional regulator [Blastocatellia bacterium]